MTVASTGLRRPTLPVIAAVLLAIALIDLTIATRDTFNIFGSEDDGMVFNSMALHLLHGRFDVNPNAIGPEAFVHDGRTYAYFGLFPALLRLPLVPFLDLTSVHVERLSCWVAMMLGTTAHIAAILAASAASGRPPEDTRVLSTRVLVTAVLSGPPLLLGWTAVVFHESILWAWAQAMIFVALAIHGLYAERGFSAALLVLMACVAGLCLLTRATTALGLYAALGLILLRLTMQANRPIKAWLLQVRQPKFYIPLAIGGFFVILTCLVNYARWGKPLTFADLREQVAMLAAFPDRLPRLEKYGLFNIRRIPFGVIYYFIPVWIFPATGLDAWISDLFDAFELPPDSFFLTDPLTMFLAIIGMWLLLRDRLRKASVPRVRMLLLGMAVTPAMMLMAWYMSFRYRADFMPFFVALSCLAIAEWEPRGGFTKRTTRLLSLLCILQVVCCKISQDLYGVSSLGPSEQYVTEGLLQYYITAITNALGFAAPGQ